MNRGTKGCWSNKRSDVDVDSPRTLSGGVVFRWNPHFHDKAGPLIVINGVTTPATFHWGYFTLLIMVIS